MSFAYLATPYTKYEHGHEMAYIMAATFAAAFLKEEIPIFSPIAHSHPMAVHGGIEAGDHKVWLTLDKHFLMAAKVLIVCQASGWDQSKGIKYEIDFFNKHHKPIHYWRPPKVMYGIIHKIKKDLK